jgi:hypothetical protein
MFAYYCTYTLFVDADNIYHFLPALHFHLMLNKQVFLKARPFMHFSRCNYALLYLETWVQLVWQNFPVLGNQIPRGTVLWFATFCALLFEKTLFKS